MSHLTSRLKHIGVGGYVSPPGRIIPASTPNMNFKELSVSHCIRPATQAAGTAAATHQSMTVFVSVSVSVSVSHFCDVPDLRGDPLYPFEVLHFCDVPDSSDVPDLRSPGAHKLFPRNAVFGAGVNNERTQNQRTELSFNYDARSPTAHSKVQSTQLIL